METKEPQPLTITEELTLAGELPVKAEPDEIVQYSIGIDGQLILSVDLNKAEKSHYTSASRLTEVYATRTIRLPRGYKLSFNLTKERGRDTLRKEIRSGMITDRVITKSGRILKLEDIQIED